MILDNITQQHVLAAIAEIDRAGVPDNRASRKFSVTYAGKNYPPKYLLSLANRHANGADLLSSAFNGGAETNAFLRSLNFTINGPSARATATSKASHTALQGM